MAQDKDNAAGLVAGILIADEVQRQAQERASEAERERSRSAEREQQARQEKERAEKIARQAKANYDDALDDLDDLRSQYARLLGRPLKEIAAVTGNLNPAFKKNYDALMLDTADWALSQKANRELAIRLGTRLGMTVEEVTEMAMEIRDDVLNERNPAEHMTNASDENLIVAYKAELNKLKLSREAAVQKRYQERVASGVIYDLLDSPPKHSVHAVKVWKRLAVEGVREAQLNLGFAYFAAYGMLPYDSMKADEWLQKALAQGDPRAPYQLYELYSQSRNPNRDQQKAEVFLEQALALSDPRAAAVRDARQEELVRQEKARQLEVARAGWLEEEPALLQQLAVIREGEYPKEVFDRIEERGYSWFHTVRSLHTMILTVVEYEETNRGSWLLPKWIISLKLSGTLPKFNGNYCNVSFSVADSQNRFVNITLESEENRWRYFNNVEAGTTFDKFALRIEIGTKDNRTQHDLTYIPKKPIVIKRVKG